MMSKSPPHRKEPVLPEELPKMAQKVDINNSEDIELMVLFSLMLFGFLRISEVCNLFNEDIKLVDEELWLLAFVHRRQTNLVIQHRYL